MTDSVQYLPGVGPWRAKLLAKLGIVTVGDLLEHFPARYERQESRAVENLEEGMFATIIGRVTAVKQRLSRRGPVVSATVLDNTGVCKLAWFNAAWMADRLERGQVIRATGRIVVFEETAQMTNPRVEFLDHDAAPVDESAPCEFEPVYPASVELSSRAIARVIGRNLDAMLPEVQEWHPPAFLERHNYPGRRAAIESMHRPRNEGELARARQRLAYDEFLLMQLAVTLARRNRKLGAAASPLRTTPEIDRRIRRRFPFPLTAAQDRAVSAIAADMNGPRPMNRLLQGDVGCGKTVVALYAALVAIANRRQVAIMAPTELLARQHFNSVSQYLDGSRVRFGLLTGGMPARRRGAMLRRIESGELDLVVGTHALIQQDVQFADLGLVVVDEQHRFGVRQRATIRSKGAAPHYLVMTATPIPRTLAMTVFGDLDVTTIDALPPGRAPIATKVVAPPEHGRTWDFVRTRLALGEQAYIVYPLVDESDKVAARAATTEFDRLSKREFAERSVGLLHGRLTSDDREKTMADFAAGRINVLVATTVIEVGIDVPRASCMVIEHAERFGLSQLHQLRGRVGRGDRRGYCFLMTGSVGAAENERLNVLARTTDGFRIAEEDLRIRGPGEFLGTRQHGLPELRVADLLRDGDLLRTAQRDAGAMIRADPRLARPEHAVLRQMLIDRYRESIGFLDVG